MNQIKLYWGALNMPNPNNNPNNIVFPNTIEEQYQIFQGQTKGVFEPERLQTFDWLYNFMLRAQLEKGESLDEIPHFRHPLEQRYHALKQGRVVLTPNAHLEDAEEMNCQQFSYVLRGMQEGIRIDADFLIGVNERPGKIKSFLHRIDEAVTRGISPEYAAAIDDLLEGYDKRVAEIERKIAGKDRIEI